MKSRYLIIAVVAGMVIAALATVAIHPLRWRAGIMLLSATGQIEDASFVELIRMITPGSGYYIETLFESRNPYFAIANPHDDETAAEAGATTYAARCASCHGHAGIGASAPALNRETYVHGDSDWSLFRNIRYGIADTAMASVSLDDRSTWEVVAYLRGVQRRRSEASPVVGLRPDPVSTDRLLNEHLETANWLSYNGGYDGQRYRALDQINRTNAHRLEVKWVHQFDGSLTTVETTPIVNGDVMYVTEPPNIVHAIDARTGASHWTFEHRNASDLKLCCGQVNRGVAVHGDTLFMGTLDAHLVALDAATGRLRWKVRMGDHRQGLSVTGAPLVVGDLVIVGFGGGDLGFRSFVDAYSVEDGTRRWRFYTVPGPGEPGNETWAGSSWETGGAATWLTGVYDPELDLIYWGVGNPAPDYQGDLRAGDNLYSCSVIALDPKTGELVWHFQFTPHDERDWDSNQIPALVDLTWEGQARKVMLWPNRNGFYYVLDRTNGEFLLAKPFARQNWALGIDERGRPILNPDTRISARGVATWPSQIGAINWHSPSYSPRTGLHYLPVLEWGQLLYKHPTPEKYLPGEPFMGGGNRPIPGEPLHYAVRAVDPLSGDVVWSHELPERDQWWRTGGLVSTAGDIVFGGDDTTLFVLDALSGDELWSLNVGGRINASPITYAVDGSQRFVMAAGRSVIALGIE